MSASAANRAIVACGRSHGIQTVKRTRLYLYRWVATQLVQRFERMLFSDQGLLLRERDDLAGTVGTALIEPRYQWITVTGAGAVPCIISKPAIPVAGLFLQIRSPPDAV